MSIIQLYHELYNYVLLLAICYVPTFTSTENTTVAGNLNLHCLVKSDHVKLFVD